MTHYESSLHIPIVTTLIYSNIFLLLLLSFQNYNAKLSDFGLARDGPEGDKTHVSTRVMGTYGYAAPEYVMTGKLKIIFLFFLFFFSSSFQTVLSLGKQCISQALCKLQIFCYGSIPRKSFQGSDFIGEGKVLLESATIN